MPHHPWPSPCLRASRGALLLGLCLLSLVAPVLVEQPDWLAAAHDGQAEITALEACALEEIDSFLLNSCWPSAWQPGIAGRRLTDNWILAHSPTLRPATPPPESYTQA